MRVLMIEHGRRCLLCGPILAICCHRYAKMWQKQQMRSTTNWFFTSTSNAWCFHPWRHKFVSGGGENEEERLMEGEGEGRMKRSLLLEELWPPVSFSFQCCIHWTQQRNTKARVNSAWTFSSNKFIVEAFLWARSPPSDSVWRLASLSLCQHVRLMLVEMFLQSYPSVCIVAPLCHLIEQILS